RRARDHNDGTTCDGRAPSGAHGLIAPAAAAGNEQHGPMLKLLKDPLVHFLAIGALLFAFAAWRGETVEVGRTQIVVPAEEVARARAAAELLHGRAPTDAEVAELVEPYVRDEVFYREALARELDV